MDDKTFLLAEAARCRRLAGDILDRRAEASLLTLAAEYEARAAALDDAADAIGVTTATLERPAPRRPRS